MLSFLRETLLFAEKRLRIISRNSAKHQREGTMRKLFFGYGQIVMIGAVVSAGLVGYFAPAVDALQWPLSIQSVEASYSDETYPCLGWYQQVTLKGEGTIQACVTGGSVKLARYYPVNSGGVHYAIQFSSDPMFYGLDACGVHGCTLSADGEMFVAFEWITSTEHRAQVYKNFVSRLTAYTPESGEGKRYRLPPQPDMIIAHPNGSPLFAASSAISENGRWVAIELKSYGTVLIDMNTLDIRRILAPGATYGLTSDPTVEMAVTNDGTQIAVMGNRTMTAVVRVDSSCGDRLTLVTGHAYQGAVTPCTLEGFDIDALITNFRWAGHPVFNAPGNMLSFMVHDRFGATRRIIARGTDFPSTPTTLAMAVGDSFTSGEGETNDAYYVGTASNACHISTRSYPYLVGNSWHASTNNVACSGATIANILTDSKKGGAQIEQVTRAQPKVLLVGIGGNDAGLMGKLSACVTLDTCEWARSEEARARSAKEIKMLYPKLRSLYAQLQVQSGAEIIVVGYPYIVNTESCSDGVDLLFNADERQFMEEALRYLNAVIKRAANDSMIRFVDTSEAFAGNKLCDSTDSPAMNAIRLGDDIAPIKNIPGLKIVGAESFHPMPFGHELISRQITTQYPTMYDVGRCLECGYVGSAPEPRAYWGASSSIAAAGTQQSMDFLEKDTANTSYAISVAKGSFKPYEKVAIEVHSTPIALGKVESAADGSIAGTVTLPVDLGHGMHSVHLKGLSSTGESIEYYDFVSIEPVDTSGGLGHEEVEPNAGDSVYASAVRDDDSTQPQSLQASAEQQNNTLGVIDNKFGEKDGESANNTLHSISFAGDFTTWLALTACAITVLNALYSIYHAKKMSREPGG